MTLNNYLRKQSSYKYPKSYVVIDIETTGLNHLINEITNIAAVRYINKRWAGEYHTYVKTVNPIPAEIVALNGIDDEMVKDAPDIKTALLGLKEFLKDDNEMLIGHNVGFDLRFLKANFSRINLTLPNPFIDTLSMSREFYPELPKHRLQDMINYFRIREEEQSHLALDDCYMCNSVYQRMVQEVN